MCVRAIVLACVRACVFVRAFIILYVNVIIFLQIFTNNNVPPAQSALGKYVCVYELSLFA